MSILNNYTDLRVDPFTGTSYPADITGTIVVPSQSNFFNQKYVIELPEVPDLTNANSFHLYDQSQNNLELTAALVGSMSNSNTNHYCVAPADSSRPHLVWVADNVAGHTLYYSYKGKGTVVNAANLRDFICNTLKVQNGAIVPQINGDVVVNGSATSTGLLTGGNIYTAGEIRTHDILAAYADIRGNADISGTAEIEQLQTESCSLYKKTCKYQYNEIVISLSTQSPSFPIINWNEYDPDKTLINAIVYTWNDSSPDQDEVFDVYRGPLRYFIAHTQEFPVPSLRKLADTHVRACYYIIELS